MAQALLRRRAGAGAAHRRSATAARTVAGTADRHSLRQRHRARAHGAGGDVCRRSLRADLAGLFAALHRLRQAAHDLRSADTGPGVCRRRHCLRPRRRRDRARRNRARGDAQSAIRPQGDAVCRFDKRRRCRRCCFGARQDRPRHHRQIPVHLRLDRHSQGRHQHPPHALLQPGDDRLRFLLRRRGAAGGGRLAAVEPHLRQQPQFQYGAGQRRLALHRRRQSDAARRAEDGAQPARCGAHHLFQRAQGLRSAGAALARRRDAAATISFRG